MEEESLSSPVRYKGYIPGLDVLRGVAILMVVAYHAFDARVPWEHATGWIRWPLLLTAYGASGVQLFFVLSGFLITGILLDTRNSPGYYRKFYVRRALRILPAYFLLLVVLRAAHMVSWRFVLAAVLYIANMAGLVGARSAEYGPLWSLAVEEQFYLLWPWIVRRLSMRTLVRGAVGYIVFAALLRLACVLLIPGVDTTFKLWFNADLLLSGALVAIGLREGFLHRGNIRRVAQTLAGLALGTFLFMALIVLTLHGPLWWRGVEALNRYVFLFGYTSLLLAVLRRNKGKAASASRSPLLAVLSFFGYISYGLYLIHQLVFNGAEHLLRHSALAVDGGHSWSLPANALLCAAVSTVIAYLSRRYFEELFLRQKEKVVPYRTPASSDRPVRETV